MAGARSDMGLIFAVILGGLLCVGGIQLSLLAIIYLAVGILDTGVSLAIAGLFLLFVGYHILNAVLSDKGYYRLEVRPVFNYRAMRPPPGGGQGPAVPPPPAGQQQGAPRYRFAQPAGQAPAPPVRQGPMPPPAAGRGPPPGYRQPGPGPAYPGYRPPPPRGPYRGPAPYPPQGGYGPPSPYDYTGAQQQGGPGGLYPRPYRTERLYSFIKYSLNIPSMRYLFIIFILALVVGFITLSAGGILLLLFLPCFIIVFVFPSLMWISYVYHQGSRAPEPRNSVFKALLWGMFSTIPAGFINTYTGLGLAESLLWMVPVIVAPINEEFFKPLGLSSLKPDIDNRIDGLIYGVTCGMGFAMTENLLYEASFLAGGGAAIWTMGSFTRGVGSTIIHGVGSGLIGLMYATYYLKRKMAREGGAMEEEPQSKVEALPRADKSAAEEAWKKAEARNRLAVLSCSPGKLVLAYIGAVLIHAGWNGLATLAGVAPDIVALGLIGVMFIYAGLMFLLLKYLVELAGGTMRFSC